MKVKTLSLTQPWASLVALGAKKIETRSWSTDYRGPLAIHAAKGFPKWAQDLCRQEPFRTALEPLRESVRLPGQSIGSGPVLPLGFIVAVCDLVDVVRIIPGGYNVAITVARAHYPPSVDEQAFDREIAFGDYTPGRHMWLLSNVKALDNPIPARGALGLWDYDLPDRKEAQS